MKFKNPIIQKGFDSNWYYPWDVPDEIREHKLYQLAVEEGWHEWIETELDWLAVKAGYWYEQSRDCDGRVCYWDDGHWIMHDGSIIEPGTHEELEAFENGLVGRGDHFCRFAESTLVFSKAPLEGKPYRFLDWSRKLVCTTFGWVTRRKEDSQPRARRFRDVIIEIAKKNSKSDLVSVIGLYMTRADFTPKSYCFAAACDRNQGKIIFNEAASYVRSSPYLSQDMLVLDSRIEILHNESGSYLKVLSADAHRNDGHDANAVLFDELHRQPNRRLWAVLERSGQARPNTHLRVTITTYGPSSTDGSIWAEVHNAAKAQLEGRDKNYRKLVWIASAEPIPVVNVEPYEPGDKVLKVSRLQQPVDKGPIKMVVSRGDEGSEDETIEIMVKKPARRFQDHLVIEPIDTPIPEFSEGEANLEWNNDHGIMRANPSVGIIFDLETVREFVRNSNSPDAIAETKQLNFNICSGSGRKFINPAAWSKCGSLKSIKVENLYGRRAFGGLDISFSNDLLAFSLALPSWDVGVVYEKVKRPLLDLLTFIWVPGDTLDERSKKEEFPYRAIAAKDYLSKGFGMVRITEGSAVDFSVVAEDIIEICSFFKVPAIGVDPNFSGFVCPALERKGLTVVHHRQGGVSMAPPTKRFDELVRRGLLRHQNNPVLTRAALNAVMHPPDRAGNTYPSKEKSYARIDPLISSIMATGFACVPPVKQSSAYSGRPGSGMFG